jgi:hypothetical protein
MASTITEKEDNKKDREAREFASALLTGTVIGRSLQDALQSLSREDAADLTAVRNPMHVSEEESGSESDSNGPPVREVLRKPIVTMNGESVDKILQSFREGVAESRIRHNPEKDRAPRAVLKGRCDCYNRYGQNWMVAMDTVKLKARPTKFTKRRRDDRPSLWDRDDDGGGRTTQKETILNKKIQLLVYGDIA